MFKRVAVVAGSLLALSAGFSFGPQLQMWYLNSRDPLHAERVKKIVEQISERERLERFSKMAPVYDDQVGLEVSKSAEMHDRFRFVVYLIWPVSQHLNCDRMWLAFLGK